MQLILKGRVFATPSAVTILSNGTEIFSGQVGSGQPLDTELTLFQTAITQPTYAQGPETLAISISATSGVVTCGDVEILMDDGTTYVIVPNEGPDLRQSILVNGSLPVWPATPVDPMPGGTESSPDWQGWFFELAAGESMTFNVIVPPVYSS